MIKCFSNFFRGGDVILQFITSSTMFSESTMKSLMVVKNFFLLGLGVLFGVVLVSLIYAYYSYKKKFKSNLKQHIQFIEGENNEIYMNPPLSYSQSLETWYTLLFRHVINSKKRVAFRSRTREKTLLISSLLFLALVFVLVTWMSLHVQYIREFQEALNIK